MVKIEYFRKIAGYGKYVLLFTEEVEGSPTDDEVYLRMVGKKATNAAVTKTDHGVENLGPVVSWLAAENSPYREGDVRAAMDGDE